MARYILNVPEPLVLKAADILADVLRDYPTSRSVGVLTARQGTFYVRRTKSGASITHCDPVEKPMTIITDEATND